MSRPVLVVLGGLPGSGKTTIARALARRIGAVHVRIDTIEQALRDSGRIGDDVADLGYRLGYAIAADNLRLGHAVIADSVNPWPVTREAWVAVAEQAGAPAIEVEIVCSDEAEHRRRVEQRPPGVPGLLLPTWADVVERDYRPWHQASLVLDTATRDVDACVALVMPYLPATVPSGGGGRD